MTIKGALLAKTFRTSVNVVPKPSVSVGNGQIGIGQYQLSDAETGRFSVGNAVMTSNNTSHPFPGMTLVVPLSLSGDESRPGFTVGSELQAQTLEEGSTFTFPNVMSDSWYQNVSSATPRLVSQEGSLDVRPDDDVPVAPADRIQPLRTWRSPGGEWFVEFHVVSERPESFRTCWYVRLPLVARRSCYGWNKEGFLVGTYIMDNSDNTGAVVYRWDLDGSLMLKSTRGGVPLLEGNIATYGWMRN